jgi:DNA-directed RNA polymerase subunit E'/Rpb7
MFVLAQIKDVARVMPSHFSEPRLKRIELEINKKYANKVS